jgi:hypothetical protein
VLSEHAEDSFFHYLQLKVGFINCIVHVLILQLAINTWGYAFFDLGKFPEWAVRGGAKGLNNTLTTVAGLGVTTPLLPTSETLIW